MVASLAAGRNGGTQTADGSQCTINVETIATWLRLFIAQDQVVELRAIHKEKGVEISYFDHAHLDDMARCAYELSESGDYKGIYFTLNPLDPALLRRAPYALQPGRAASTDRDVTCRRWMLIDVDPQRDGGVSAADAEKDMAKNRALEIGKYLRAQGWPIPVLADSGNGYHVLVRIDLPGDDGNLVRRVLHALADRFDSEGITVDRKVFNPSRLTKVYGTMSRKGIATTERPHRYSAVVYVPPELVIAPLELLERLAGTAPVVPTSEVIVAGEHAAAPGVSTISLADKLRRAERYLDKVPAAVQGKGGDKQTFTVACLLIKDFDLTIDDALPLLLKYNQKCVPPWDEKELRRKLELADQKDGERGRLLKCHRRALTQTSGDGDGSAGAAERVPFCGHIPDFVLADWQQVCPHPRPVNDQGKRRRGRWAITEGLSWVLHRELIRQKCSRIVLADVELAQAVWGAGPLPPNWRQRLAKYFYGRKVPGAKRPDVSPTCSTACALWGQGVPHRHFTYEAKVSERRGVLDGTFLGALEYYAVDEKRVRTYNFAPNEWDDPDTLETIQQYRKAGRICAVYLPVLIFSPSPRSGLSHEQRQILIALTRETTRSRRSERQDKAAIVVGCGLSSTEKATIASCPFLEAGVRYVGFNGNGTYKRRHLRGRGYHLVGRSKGGWLPRAGFEVPNDAKGTWQSVQRFLKALVDLAEPFGLVVAAYHAAKHKWIPLAELVEMTRIAAGRAWLKVSQLRVYTRQDYLARWRQCFANRLGFSFIPGGDEDAIAAPVKAVQMAGEVPSINSALELDAWMRKAKVTDAALAKRLGVSRSYVSGHRSGRRPWSKAFQAKVEAVLAAGSFE